MNDELKILYGGLRRVQEAWYPKERFGICPIDAMYDAHAHEVWVPGIMDDSALLSAEARFKRATGLGDKDIVQVWNDEPVRAKQEILTAFVKAIEEAEKENIDGAA